MAVAEAYSFQRMLNSETVVPPDTSRLKELSERLDYNKTKSGRMVLSMIVRGSTAALLPPNGNISLRTRKSDVDLVALVSADKSTASYYPQAVLIDQTQSSGLTTKVDVLSFNRRRFDLEVAGSRTFLQTKLLHPSWTVSGDDSLNVLKAESLANLITKSTNRNGIRMVTPSGAAALSLEQNLYVEPWRWLSLRTYYVDSPYYARNRTQLVDSSSKGLELLVERGKSRVKGILAGEKVYELFQQSEPNLLGNIFSSRLVGLLMFFSDQLTLSGKSERGLEPKRIRGFYLSAVTKLRALSTNPTLDYRINRVFD